MNNTTDSESDLLAECPVCEYALRGLPVEHVCPECGLPFDRRWWVYGGPALPREWGKWFRSGRVVLLLPAAWVLVATVILLIVRASPGERIGFITLMVAALGLLIWLALYKPRRFVALGPDGLVVYYSPKRIERYPWTRISRPRNDLFRKSLAFESGGQTIRVKAHAFFANDVVEIDRCVRGINAYPRPERD